MTARDSRFGPWLTGACRAILDAPNTRATMAYSSLSNAVKSAAANAWAGMSTKSPSFSHRAGVSCAKCSFKPRDLSISPTSCFITVTGFCARTATLLKPPSASLSSSNTNAPSLTAREIRSASSPEDAKASSSARAERFTGNTTADTEPSSPHLVVDFLELSNTPQRFNASFTVLAISFETTARSATPLVSAASAAVDASARTNL
mmetsp:Transcript_284/g.767  ORF Transcript_284/g.767 Transcript_284/m.767 type:complete len:205 (-) Transcript_284:662-1276(-)